MSDVSYNIQEESLIRSDIGEYLNRHETKDLLRVLTCGSVDDGKSTLIGRLLCDCHKIYEDQLEQVTRDSSVYGTTDTTFDPALLTDGLKAEREQGITIDVAYRYFSTDQRKFIIADCPGHEQYTRNMVTGASTCNLAIILIDARYGVVQQTRRHSFICSLLGIRHVVIAINKMDLVDWSQARYEAVQAQYNGFVSRLNFSDIHFIPLSALHGDNVVEHGSNLNWYDGPTFLHHLESVNISTDRNLIDMRFPVQCVLRPNLDFRGFSGTLASGVLRVGDAIACLPSRHESTVRALYGPDGPLSEAFSPQAITVQLNDEIDVSRGDMLVPVNNMPRVGNELEAMVVWMHEQPACVGRTYLMKHTSNLVPVDLSCIRYKVDVNTMQREESAHPIDGARVGIEAAELDLNEIGRCLLTLHRAIPFDSYDRNRATGSCILIDRLTHLTVGACMILDRRVATGTSLEPVSKNIVRSASLVSDADRRQLLNQRGATVWLTGLSGSGKSTIARQLERALIDSGHACYLLDGDNVRHGLNRDLGFSAEARTENIRRIAEVAQLFNRAGLIAITAFISPNRRDRQRAAEVIGDGFVEVFVDTPLATCEQRDPKGLYKKARAGEISQFTGISAPYEAPVAPSLRLSTASLSVDESVALILTKLREDGAIT